MKNYTLILLLAAMILFGCKQQTENSDSASLTNVTRYTPSKRNQEIADSIMLNAYRKGAMWDTFWDDAPYNEIYGEVRREAGMFGFFYQNGLPYCVFSKEEWSSMTDVQRVVATRIAQQRYKARRLVKSFFSNYYGEITRFYEHYSITDDGVTVSYNLTALKHDEVDTEFSLGIFVIDLHAPRFKYYSTMRERNPDPNNYRGLMERGAQPMYYGKWIDCNINDSFFDIATLVMHVKKILDPKLMLELAISSCHNIQKQNNNETAHIFVLGNIENNMVPESQDTIIEKNLHNEGIQNNPTDISSDNRSINEIRFNGWTDKDWLDNDYIRTLRKYIDAYCRGEIKSPDLDQYKSIMQSKFIVLNIEPFIAGGTFITIAFLDNPQCVFNSWVYSEVNSNNQVVDYVAKGLRLVDTEYPMTKEEILEIIKEHPEHKLW